MDRKVKKDFYFVFNFRNFFVILWVFFDIGCIVFFVLYLYLYVIFLLFCVGDCDECMYLVYVLLLCS